MSNLTTSQLLKFYDGSTIAELLQNLWCFSDPEYKGPNNKRTDVSYWLAEEKWPDYLIPLEKVWFTIKNRDERFNPGTPCKARQCICRLKNWSKRKRKRGKLLFKYLIY